MFLSTGFVGFLIAVFISSMPSYSSEKFRTIRLGISVLCTLPYVVGLMIAINVIHKRMIPSYYRYLTYAVCFELTAAFFYVTMYPEKILPYVLDNILSSHSLWHWFNFGFDINMMQFAFESYQAISLMEKKVKINRNKFSKKNL
jgi:hypothetical protein